MELEILTYIEQKFYETGRLPTKESLCEHFNLDLRRLAAYMRRSNFKTAYEARGLPSYQTTKANDQGLLTPIQLAVANVILNVHDRQTIRRKLQAMNVTTAQFQAWQKQEAFQSYLRRESIARFNNTDVDARLSLTKLVQDSDLNAIKYYFELNGTYNPANQQLINLTSILATLMEILVRYLGPQELQEVAEQLELLLTGQLSPQNKVNGKRDQLPVRSIEATSAREAEFVNVDIYSDEHNYGLERDAHSGSEGGNFTLPRIWV